MISSVIKEAQDLSVRGRLTEALDHLVQHEDALSDSVAWWRQQGLILEQMERLEEALERFEYAQALAKQHGWLRVDIARVLEKQGQNDEALLRLLSPPIEDEVFPYAINVSARLAKSTGNDELLVETARRACALGGNEWALLELGQALQGRGHASWAKKILGKISAEHPASISANRKLGEIAIAEGDNSEAERRLRLAAAEASDSWTSLDLANILAKRGEYTEAFWILSQAQIKFPDEPWLLKNAAEYSLKLGSAEFAISLRSKISQDHPAYKDCLRFFSCFLNESHNIDALRRFTSAALAKRAYDLLEPALAASLRLSDFTAYWEALVSARKDGNMDDKLAFALIGAATQGRCLDECRTIFQDITQNSALHTHLADVIALQSCKTGNTEHVSTHFRKTLHSPRSGENSLHIARQLASAGIYDEALAILATVHANDAQKLSALRAVVDIGQTAGESKLVLNALQEIEARIPTDTWIGFQIAERLEALGERGAAINKFKEIPPGNMPFLAAQRRLLNLDGQLWSQAERQAVLARTMTGAPKETNGQLELIIFLIEAKEFKAAWKILKDLPQEVQNGVDGQIAIARILNGEGRKREAMACLEALGETAPNTAHTLLASLKRDVGDLASAEVILERVVAGNSQDFWSYLSLADIARQRGAPTRAEQWLAAAQSLKPGNVSIDLAQAQIYADAEKWQEALDLLEQTEVRHPGNQAIMTRRAHVFRDAGRHDEALVQHASINDKFPNDIEAWIDRAEEEFRQGYLTESHESLLRARELSPRHPRLLAVLAARAVTRDDLDTAIELQRQAAAIEPKTLWSQLALSHTLSLLGQFDEAIKTIDQVETHFDRTPQSIAARADLLRRTGYLASARALLTEGKAQFPDNFHLWFQAAQIDIDLGAFEEVDAALSMPPVHNAGERASLHLCRAMLAMARWEFQIAISELHSAISHSPSHGHALSLLSTAQLLNLDLANMAQTLKSITRLNWARAELRGDTHNPSQSHAGQLLDEFLIDADGLEALRTALSLPTTERLTKLANILQRYPDYTAAAIMWMIEARRQGVFSDRSATGTLNEKQIPRRLFQFWDTDVPPNEVLHLMKSWTESHPNWEYQKLSSRDARKFLDQTYGNTALAAYDRAREPAMKADIIRLALLAAFGGVYVDADDRCVTAIEPLLQTGDRLIVYQEDLGSIGNNFIAAVPSHPIILDALTRAIEAINRGDGDIVWLATGPGLLTRCLAHAITSEEGVKYLTDTRVLTRHELAHYNAIHCLTAYKSTKLHWSRTSFGKRIVKMPF
jgi:mannosyltransferase OCH1-like enzyme/Flp pilus assembly protein TadD